MAARAHYDFIDVTRAVAAFLVVVSHVQQLIVDRPLTPGAVHRALSMLTTQGHNAVVIFFVISGFWIVRSVVRAGPAFSFKDYMIARCARLWVVLLPALVMGACLDLAGSTIFASRLYAGTQGAVSVAYDVSSRLSFGTFLGNALFLQDIAVPPFGSNGALWTIACEFWYYVYFPLAYCALRSRNLAGIVAAAAALPFLPSLPLFACWMMGGAVYLLAERFRGARNIPRAWPAAALALLCLAVVALKLVPLHPALRDLALAACFALFLGLGINSSFGRARGLGFLARFGARSSYSLYATHLPLMVFLCNFIVPAARLPASPGAWALVLLFPAVAVAWAAVFSGLTEDRTTAVRNWAAAVLGMSRQVS